MNEPIPDTLIEIHDPELDPAQIMADIRARIRRRREELGYDNRAFPTFGLAVCPEEPEDIPYDVNLYHHLRLANERYGQLDTSPALVSSPATRLPLIGRLWQAIRGHAHSLVLFYVSRVAGYQMSMNRHLISVLNQLTRLTQEQQRTIIALQAEVEALREQIEKKCG
jgi:hypothetical protein